MTQHTTLVKSYPDPGCAVTDADGQAAYPSRGNDTPFFVIAMYGAYLALLAFILSAKGV